MSNEMTVAEVQLTYKTKVKASSRPKISKSEDAYFVIKDHWNFEIIEFIEEFKLILLNRANKVLGLVNISLGGSTGTIADPKVIFMAALKSNACGIILAHNHPSGNLTPSESDINLTRKLRAAGELLDIAVLDHIIITAEGFYSFTDEGLM